MRHIKPSKIRRTVEGRTDFDDNDRTHLERCEDCQHVFAVFKSYVAEDKDEKKGRGI